MTTFKQRFQREFGGCKTESVKYSLKNIKDQSPKVYSAGAVMKQYPGKRCDSFVLCLCAPSTTGIYVVEEKGNYLPVETVRKQLQNGANFLCGLLRENDKFEFSPVLVAKGIPPSTLKKFLLATVRLREKNKYIKHIKPSAPLKPIVTKRRENK